MRKTVLFICLSLCLLIKTNAQETESIRWYTPEWEAYTDKDGSGLFNDLIRELLSAEYHIVRTYVPWKRALLSVENGIADMTGSDEPGGNYLTSELPVLESIEVILYRKSSIPEWKGLSSLKYKSGIWILGYTDNMPKELTSQLEGQGVASRNQALEVLVNRQQIDYYLDNRYQLMQSLRNFEGSIDLSEFDSRTITTSKLYWLFSKTPRGQKIKKTFDDKFAELYCLERLKPIYKLYKQYSSYPKIRSLCKE